MSGEEWQARTGTLDTIAEENHGTGVSEDVQSREERRLWRRIIKNFMPSWFAVTMGTGVVSSLLFSLPYNGIWLYWISVSIFLINILIWCTFLVLTVSRLVMYPWTWSRHLRDNMQAVFIATCPTGLSTIINMIVYVCVPAWGGETIKFAWALWWLDAAASTAACLYLPYAMISFQKTSLSQVNAAWLLPMVATIVASATGSLLADSLPNPAHALWTTMTCYILLGTSLITALMIITLYLARLAIHGPPPKEIVVSGLIVLGPLGSGSFAFLQLGRAAKKVFSTTHTLAGSGTAAGDVLYVIGWLIALLLVGLSIMWLFIGLGCIVVRRPKFNMSWWAFTFPLGVFTAAVVQIATETSSRFLSVVGTIMTAMVTLLWLLVSFLTVRRLCVYGVFLDPSLKAQSSPASAFEDEGKGEKVV